MKKAKKEATRKPRAVVLVQTSLGGISGGDDPGSMKIKETVVAD
jgi:hypothetical protein